jgi:hypothetical protein
MLPRKHQAALRHQKSQTCPRIAQERSLEEMLALVELPSASNDE